MKKKLLSLLLVGAVIGGGASSMANNNQEVKDIKVQTTNSIESKQIVMEEAQNKRMSRGDNSFVEDLIKKNENTSREGLITTFSENKDTEADLAQEVPKKEDVVKIETINWWSEANKVFARGIIAQVEDVYSGKKFMIKRTTGTNHADCETLTKEDTKIMKEIWGGYTWERRPIVLEINGRKLAASMAGMPHAGIDSAPALAVINKRSGGYGKGQNLDFIKDNEMNGVFDVHFPGSTRHMDRKAKAVVDPEHQKAIQVAAQAHN